MSLELSKMGIISGLELVDCVGRLTWGGRLFHEEMTLFEKKFRRNSSLAAGLNKLNDGRTKLSWMMALFCVAWV